MQRRLSLVPLMLALTLLTGACKSSATTSSPASGAAAAAPSVATASAAPAQTAAATASAAASPQTSGCPTSNATAFAKTKLVLHAGLAFGAFHRYLYKPYKAGTFTSGSKLHRVFVISKAAASALFIKREIRLSIADVNANPALCNAVASPLRDLQTTISDGISKLKNGDTSALDQANQTIGAIQTAASGHGLALPDNTNAPAS